MIYVNLNYYQTQKLNLYCSFNITQFRDLNFFVNSNLIVEAKLSKN